MESPLSPIIANLYMEELRPKPSTQHPTLPLCRKDVLMTHLLSSRSAIRKNFSTILTPLKIPYNLLLKPHKQMELYHS